MNKSAKFWVLSITALLFLLAGSYIVFQKCCRPGPDTNSNKNDNSPRNDNNSKNVNSYNVNFKPDPNSNTVPNTDFNGANTNKTPDVNVITNVNTNSNTDMNTNVNSNKITPRQPPVNPKEASIRNLKNLVYFNGERMSDDQFIPGITKPFDIRTEPNGLARIQLKCQEINYFNRKGEIGELKRENDGINQLIRLVKGIFTVLSNCNVETKTIAGNTTIYPNGTVYTVAYFPDDNDRSKDKTMIIVLEKSVTVESLDTNNSQNETKSSTKIVNDSQFIILTKDKIGNFDDNKVYSFKDYNYDQMKEVYEAFEMKKWIPQVLEFYEEKKGSKNDNANEKLFPLPSPTASPSAFNWEGTRIVSENLIVENPIETPLNLTLSPPCIQQKNAESCKSPNPQWKSKVSSDGLAYNFENDAGSLYISFGQACRAFTKEKYCHITLGYVPKQLADVTDQKIIFNHNAEKDGKIEIPLNIKILPEAKFKIESSFLFLDKEKIIGETESESIEITADGKIEIVQTEILDANGKASENYTVKENTCIKNSLLKAGDKCRINVEFTPKTEGQHLEKLLIGDEFGGQKSVSLLGEGLKSDTTNTNTADITKVKISLDKLNFSPQLIKTESKFREVKVTADGSNPVEIGKIAFDNLGNYRVEDNCGGKIIDGNSSCSIKIFFTPKNVKIQKEIIKLPIKILSIDKKVVLAEDNKLVELSGISINIPDPICFNERQKKVKLNSSEPRKIETVEIEKFGDREGIIKSIEVVSDVNSKVKSEDFFIIDENCKGKSGDTCSIKIGFTPRKKKIRRGTLLIKFDNNTEPIKIPISGIGKPRNGFCRIIFKLRNKKLKPC